MNRILTILLLLVLSPVIAQGQDDRAVFEQWIDRQEQGLESFSRIEVSSVTSTQAEGPFGEVQETTRSRWTGSPGEGWKRTIESVDRSRDGERPRRRGPREEARGIPRMRFLDELVSPPFFPLSFYRDLEWLRTPVRERENGLWFIRCEMAPVDDRRLPIERLTLWFESGTGKLVRTRSIVERGNNQATLETTYERIGTLDVPRKRTVQAYLKTKRRIRTFTRLVRSEVTFSNYSFAR